MEIDYTELFGEIQEAYRVLSLENKTSPTYIKAESDSVKIQACYNDIGIMKKVNISSDITNTYSKKLVEDVFDTLGNEAEFSIIAIAPSKYGTNSFSLTLTYFPLLKGHNLKTEHNCTFMEPNIRDLMFATLETIGADYTLINGDIQIKESQWIGREISKNEIFTMYSQLIEGEPSMSVGLHSKNTPYTAYLDHHNSRDTISVEITGDDAAVHEFMNVTEPIFNNCIEQCFNAGVDFSGDWEISDNKLEKANKEAESLSDN